MTVRNLRGKGSSGAESGTGKGSAHSVSDRQ